MGKNQSKFSNSLDEMRKRRMEKKLEERQAVIELLRSPLPGGGDGKEGLQIEGWSVEKADKAKNNNDGITVLVALLKDVRLEIDQVNDKRKELKQYLEVHHADDPVKELTSDREARRKLRNLKEEFKKLRALLGELEDWSHHVGRIDGWDAFKAAYKDYNQGLLFDPKYSKNIDELSKAFEEEETTGLEFKINNKTLYYQSMGNGEIRATEPNGKDLLKNGQKLNLSPADYEAYMAWAKEHRKEWFAGKAEKVGVGVLKVIVGLRSFRFDQVKEGVETIYSTERIKKDCIPEFIKHSLTFVKSQEAQADLASPQGQQDFNADAQLNRSPVMGMNG